ncbi:MAG: hypothetical protein ACYS8Z_02840 [Planctomycetota bacterium]
MSIFVCDVYGKDSERSNVWVLKFSDDFERDELGGRWTSNDAVIRDGRLLVGVKGPACAKLVAGFPSDVRIEFTAEAYEGRPPCDLSVTLAAERFREMSWNYLLAFGGVNNTVNKLTGGRRLKGMRDENPKRLIEPGRVYEMVAFKEGKRLSLIVDGEVLLEGEDEEIMGGPGFDAVGLVTWHGMYVDNVRVYERKKPHPYTPQYVLGLGGLVLSTDESRRLRGPDGMSEQAKKAVEAYNKGDFAAAQRIFESLDGEIRAAGLAYVYGNLNCDEDVEGFPIVARLFEEMAKSRPSDERLADYARAASLFGAIRLFPRSEKECSGLMSLGEQNNPFYDKAKLYRARFLRANGQEGGNGNTLALARRMFEELKAKAPNNVVLRELTGEAVPWGADLVEYHRGAPRWAALLNEMYVRQLAIMHWWFTERQLADGQLCGGWGDDVEILRSWGPWAMISDAEPSVRDGIEKLCQGVWDHVLVDGFSPGVGDVEHSAEPSADTLPTMLAIRYGDPLWYERNLASCRRIRNYYTGIDDNGFVRFKSGHFGGDKASEHLQHGGDTHYSPRPMKHFLWPAWYGNNEAKDFYLNWVRGWVKVTMTKKYSKVAGVPPATIWYPSGDIVPGNGAAWNDATYNIYGCCQIGSFRIQETFLSGYYLSGDAYFLEPLHAWMRFYKMEMPRGSASNPDVEEDPMGWAIRNSKDTWKAERPLMEYRWMTDDDSYDKLFGVERLHERLHMPGTFEDYINSLEGAVGRLRVNFNLYTREMLQTDRAGLPGSDTAFSAFTGGVGPWRDAGVPTMAVTWHAPNRNFAAIVPYASRERLRVWIYNFSDESARMGMKLWRLAPGEYEVKSGLPGKGEGYSKKCKWGKGKQFFMRHKGDVFWIDVPGQKEFAVDIRLVWPAPPSAILPDPAIADRDVTVARDSDGNAIVAATVHNLGNWAVKNLGVSLVRGGESGFAEIARQTVNLPGSKDMQSSRVKVIFKQVDFSADMAVLLDPEEDFAEIYELNNRANVPAIR